jgi:hypothetical protein
MHHATHDAHIMGKRESIWFELGTARCPTLQRAHRAMCEQQAIDLLLDEAGSFAAQDNLLATARMVLSSQPSFHFPALGVSRALP